MHIHMHNYIIMTIHREIENERKSISAAKNPTENQTYIDVMHTHTHTDRHAYMHTYTCTITS